MARLLTSSLFPQRRELHPCNALHIERGPICTDPALFTPLQVPRWVARLSRFERAIDSSFKVPPRAERSVTTKRYCLGTSSCGPTAPPASARHVVSRPLTMQTSNR